MVNVNNTWRYAGVDIQTKVSEDGQLKAHDLPTVSSSNTSQSYTKCKGLSKDSSKLNENVEIDAINAYRNGIILMV